MTKRQAVIEFENPPSRSRTGGAPADPTYARAANELRGRPGEWGRLVLDFKDANAAGAIAHKVRNGVLAAFRTGRWEAKSRVVDGEPRVWLRFLGE